MCVLPTHRGTREIMPDYVSTAKRQCHEINASLGLNIFMAAHRRENDIGDLIAIAAARTLSLSRMTCATTM